MSLFAVAYLMLGLSLRIGAERTYTIETTWDGQPVDHPPATVSLSASEDGDLVLKASAPFFNSPIPPEPMLQSCPERPYLGLWEYEVVEAFFLNDANQYLEVELSPRGRYIILMLDGQRKDVLHTLPLTPDGVQLDNPCLETGQPDCTDRWTATAIIPRHFLPDNVTRFNAYAIHGAGSWGEASPADKVYEALYPAADGQIEQPDFHYLAGFGPIDLEDEDIEFFGEEGGSDLWDEVVEQNGISIMYPMSERECRTIEDGHKYSANVTVTRMNEEQAIKFEFAAYDDRVVYPYIPEKYQSPDNNQLWPLIESFWLTLSNKKSEMFRFGVSPHLSHRAHLRESDAWMAGHDGSYRNNLRDLPAEAKPDYSCDASGQQDRPYEFTCTVTVPWSLLPPNVTHFQAMHVHQPLTKLDVDDTHSEEDYQFLAMACPGQPSGKVDFTGCQIDARSIVDKEQNKEHSQIWKDTWDIE